MLIFIKGKWATKNFEVGHLWPTGFSLPTSVINYCNLNISVVNVLLVNIFLKNFDITVAVDCPCLLFTQIHVIDMFVVIHMIIATNGRRCKRDDECLDPNSYCDIGNGAICSCKSGYILSEQQCKGQLLLFLYLLSFVEQVYQFQNSAGTPGKQITIIIIIFTAIRESVYVFINVVI